MSDSFSHLYAGALIRNQKFKFFLKPSYPSTLNAKKFQKCFRIRKTLLSFKPCLTVFFESHYKLFNATVFANRLFPSSPRLLYQNDVKCSAFDMEMICIDIVRRKLILVTLKGLTTYLEHAKHWLSHIEGVSPVVIDNISIIFAYS